MHTQICYYATDRITPVYSELQSSLQNDMAVVRAAALHYNKHPELRACENPKEKVSPEGRGESPWVGYVLPTHPGHHASRDNFGVSSCLVDRSVMSFA